MKPQVVCLGAVNLDLSYQVDDIDAFLRQWGDSGLSRGGEAALAAGEETRLHELLSHFARPLGQGGGGQAANTAFALAKMGVPTALLGRVGADDAGEFLKESLTGVNLDHLVQAGDSGRAYILIDPEGERTILVAPNTNDDLSEEDIPWELVAGAEYVHFTSFAGHGPLMVQGRLARRLPDGPHLSLDPGELYARQGWLAIEDILDHLETLIVTEAEWAMLGGEMGRHPNWGPPLIVIKRGAKGARLLNPLRHLDFPVEFFGRPVDTLGAGDVFAAGYIAGRWGGLHVNAAVRLGNRAAAFSLLGRGRKSYPDKDFLEAQIIALSG
jgi:sugar/nucleoside kinase (ribokinase family)